MRLINALAAAMLVAGATHAFATAYPFQVWENQIIAVPASPLPFKTYYVDGTSGADTNTGLVATQGAALAGPLKTINKALTKIAAGDTVLIKAGLYREGIDMTKTSANGTASAPITFGSFGNGEVILDGSTKVTWTKACNASPTIWCTTNNFANLAVVVNEVPLKQVRQGQGGGLGCVVSGNSTAPQEGIAGVLSGSGKWHRQQNSSTSYTITADFGSTIGSADPNLADVIVPSCNKNQQHVFFFNNNHIKFKGLTIRGSGGNGVWGYGSNITLESCNVKFNAHAAISFQAPNAGQTYADNAVIYTHVYHNVLENWPRGNNGYAESAGGWPGTVVWQHNLRPLARGNVVHFNGGEGIISYGSTNGVTSGSALFEQNVAYDNWSVNMYFDNQPNNIARQNFLMNHPVDTNNYIYWNASGPFPWDTLQKFTVCLMLADEFGSGDSNTGYAALANTQVVNNILAGCRISIRDYSEGSPTENNHGLKNTVIANNTIIMPFNQFQGTQTYGIYLTNNKVSGTQRNTGSVIKNNIIYGFNQDFVLYSELTGAQTGLDVNNNLYFSTASRPFGGGASSTTYTFATWKTAMAPATPAWDTVSQFADPVLVDIAGFRTGAQGAPTEYDYTKAMLQSNSPAIGTGASGLGIATDYAGSPRASPPAIGAFEYGAVPVNGGRLVNISTRMKVLTGNDVMIAGFVISGASSKTVVVRARGPSLVPAGIANPLANPTLTLVRSSDGVTLAACDDWQNNSNAAQIAASGFAPSVPLEPAVMMTLQPGAYTAIVQGVGGGTGVAIVEVFEVDAVNTPFINISTRGNVQTGNDVMIGGFIIQGSQAKTVVVRARGPSLQAAGISNFLADPTIQLVSGAGTVLDNNDDWQTHTNAGLVTSSGFAPSSNKESAIYVTLAPGAYTVIVSGVGGTSGVGIIEVFVVN